MRSFVCGTSGRRAASRLAMVALAVTLGALSARAEVKKSIAVAPIGWSAGTVSWITGEAIHAQLITELTKSGRYIVVERENLDGILKEQDMGTEGRSRKSSAPATGDIEGAQLMIKATVTDAEEKSGKNLGGSIGGLSLGGEKTYYQITMDVRIYDTQTGKILSSEPVTAQQEKKGTSGGISVGGLSLGGGKKGGDTTGEITRNLIKEAIAKIDAQSKKLGWKGIVLTNEGGKVTIRGGERDGLEKGMKLKVAQLGAAVKDPETGEVLDAGEEKVVGGLEITEVKEKISYCSKTDGQEPKKGDVVILETK